MAAAAAAAAAFSCFILHCCLWLPLRLAGRLLLFRHLCAASAPAALQPLPGALLCALLCVGGVHGVWERWRATGLVGGHA